MYNYYYPVAREMIENLTQIQNMTDEYLREVCSYILLAYDQKLALNFTPTYDDMVICSQIADIHYYGISYGISELWHIGAYEFINQLYELSLKYTENVK